MFCLINLIILGVLGGIDQYFRGVIGDREMLSEMLAVGGDQPADELAPVSKSFQQCPRHRMEVPRGTTICSEGSSARSSSAVLYMASLAGEQVRLPRCVMKIGAGDLTARPWKFNRCEGRLVLNKGTWKARLQNLGQGAYPRTTVRRFLNEKALQSFFDNGLFIRELAVLDLPSEQPLKIVCESDVNHVESSQPPSVRFS